MNYFLKRIFLLVAILLVTTFFTSVIIRLGPSDPAVVACATSGTQDCIEKKREEFRLNDSVPVAYLAWLGDAVRGDLGQDKDGADLVPQYLDALPTTLALVIYSQIIALGLAIPAALIAARRPDRAFDKASSGTAFFLLALPPYVLALPLLAIFGVVFVTGVLDVRAYLPAAIALACTDFAVYLRLFRSDLIATLQEDYITMARAKGLSPRRILWRHAFRPSSFTLLTSAGLNFGRLIGGTLIVEVIFAIPGMGLLISQGFFADDAAKVLAGVSITVILFVILLFLIDIVYGLLDPRIRHARSVA